jgi:hypothetical protein
MYWKNFSRKEEKTRFLFLLFSFLMREADEEQWPCSWQEASGHAPAHPLSRPDGFQLFHTLTTGRKILTREDAWINYSRCCRFPRFSLGCLVGNFFCETLL